jgi:hypothetical protein
VALELSPKFKGDFDPVLKGSFSQRDDLTFTPGDFDNCARVVVDELFLSYWNGFYPAVNSGSQAP